VKKGVHPLRWGSERMGIARACVDALLRSEYVNEMA
jgi:hypothetical protein